MSTERMKKITAASRLVWVVLLSLALAGLVACGGGKKDTAVATDDSAGMDIDQLLGIDQQKDEEKIAEDKKADDEAEVLRLLGISPEAEKDADSGHDDDGEHGHDDSQSVEGLEAKVKRLERELAEKEVVIADLRKDLEEKDRRLTALQTQALAGKSTTPQPAASSSSAASGSFKSRYNRALELYKARRYKDAIAAFSELLAENPNHSLSDNCQYWIGEAYYGLGNFEQAIAEFEKVYSYPNSNKLDDAIIKLGVTYLKLGNREAARSQFEQLIANYPKSEFVELARSYLAKL